MTPLDWRSIPMFRRLFRAKIEREAAEADARRACEEASAERRKTLEKVRDSLEETQAICIRMESQSHLTRG